VADGITIHTRKRLWTRSGGICAFPGCGQQLLEAAVDEDTVVGVECHIVAQRDVPTVARAPCLLTDDEKGRWRHLIERRNSFDNLVVMCGTHSTLIDDPAQDFTVENVVQMKRSHESAMDDVRLEQIAGRRQSVPIEARETVVQAVVLPDAPRWRRKALDALARESPEELQWLLQRIGEPTNPAHLSDLVTAWPDELESASGVLLNAIARTAESGALWDLAATVWERWAAQLDDDVLKADHLVRAAQGANVAGDHERRHRLLEMARTFDPDSPRLRLEHLDDAVRPEVQLRVLEEIESTDPALSSMIAVRQARAAMLLPDLEAAAAYLARAAKLDPESIAVRATEINLVVQRGRIALSTDLAFPLAEMRQAQADALELRDEFADMGRWAESGSMLMLAADAGGLLRDPESAKHILDEALPAELEVAEGAEVLGDAALRSGSPDLAIRFTNAAAKSDGIRRIRATAEVDIGGPARQKSLEVLEELALGSGPEAEYAAFARLGACMPPVLADWSEEVAEVLVGGPHDRVVQSLRILALARTDVEQAWRLAEELPEEVWAAEIRLRVAGVSGNKDRMQLAAEAFLKFSPDASGRLLSAQALGHAGNHDRARAVSAEVAADLNAPPRVRADGFALLMTALAELDEWTEATRRWEQWQQLSFTELERPDPRVSSWQVRVAHHQTHSTR
jgi:hypothetical protein